MHITASSMTNYLVSRALSGVLQCGGKPIANAKITRFIKWNNSDTPLVDYFKTDAKGRFSIPANKQHLAISPLTQYAAKVRLDVEHEESSSDFWYEVIMDASPLQIGDTHNLVCEVVEKLQRVHSPSGLLGTKCRGRACRKMRTPIRYDGARAGYLIAARSTEKN